MGPILSMPPIHRAVWAGAIEEKVVQLPDRSFLTIWTNGDRLHSKEVSINEEVIGYDVGLNHSTDYVYSLGDFPILYNFEAVRKMILPFAIAGVARVISSSEFRPSTSNSGPALMTNVSPSSLSAKILPLYAQGDAVNSVPAVMRCRR